MSISIRESIRRSMCPYGSTGGIGGPAEHWGRENDRRKCRIYPCTCGDHNTGKNKERKKLIQDFTVEELKAELARRKKNE